MIARYASLLVACLFLAAAPGCDLGSVNLPPLPDAALPDAAPGSNALGQVCDVANPACPTSPPHTCVTLSIGSQTQGYCSPMCTADQDCRTGYTGPSTGMAYCLVPGTENACSIQCTTASDCPPGLECTTSGGPASFCVVPAAVAP